MAIKQFEQVLMRGSCIDQNYVSKTTLAEMIETLLRHLSSHHQELALLEHDILATKLLAVMM
jgi:hypothetical protein